MTLTATDEESEVAETNYRVDGGAWTPYSAPFTVSADGEHEVEYYSADDQGNEEEPQSFDLALDQAAPQTTAQLNGAPPGSTYDGPVALTLTASDAASGVAASDYRINGGAWTAYNPVAPPVVSEAGAHTLDYRWTTRPATSRSRPNRSASRSRAGLSTRLRRSPRRRSTRRSPVRAETTAGPSRSPSPPPIPRRAASPRPTR